MRDEKTKYARVFTEKEAMSDPSEFQTPPEVAEYMVKMLNESVPFNAHVLEPTPGKGNIVTELKSNYFKVTAPEDFFLLDPSLKFDAVVMNPPFSSRSANMENAPVDVKGMGMKTGYYILQECMKKAPVIIALMPWFVITDSDVRLRNFNKFGLVSVTALPRKTFDYCRIQTCILELRLNHRKTTEFRTFDFI